MVLDSAKFPASKRCQRGRRWGVIQMLPEAELCWEQTAGRCCSRALVRSYSCGGVRVDRKAEPTAVCQGAGASPRAGSASSPPARLPVLEFTWEFWEACWAEGSCREWQVTAQVLRPLAAAAARTLSLDPGEPNLPSSGLPSGTRRAQRGRAGSSAPACVPP